MEGENLRLSIELDPYEDIKLDLQLQQIIPLQLSSDEKVILASSDIDYTEERPKEEPEQLPINPIMSFRPTKKNSVKNSPEVSKEMEEWGEENCQKVIEEGDEKLKETAYLKLAFIKHEQRKYEEAIENYNMIGSKTEDILLNLSECYYKIQKYQEGNQVLEKIKIDKISEPSKYYLLKGKYLDME